VNQASSAKSLPKGRKGKKKKAAKPQPVILKERERYVFEKKEVPCEVLSHILSLKQKLAQDGVIVTSLKTIELGLNSDLD